MLKLERILRQADQQDKEEFRPEWKCHCCQDTGLVKNPGAIIRGYQSYDPPVVCVRKGCGAAQDFKNGEYAGSYDLRFTSEACEELHELSLHDWALTLREWHEKRTNGVNPHSEAIAQVKQFVGGMK